MDQSWKQLSRREKVRRLQREAILDAAEQVFAAKGYHEAKMEDIAVLAEFATGSLYNYFPSKEKIFEAMSQRRLNELYDQLVAAMEPETDFLTLIRRLASIHVAFMDEHRSFFEIFATMSRCRGLSMPTQLADQFTEQYRRYEVLLEKILGIGIDQGLLRRLNTKAMASAFTAVLDAAIFNWIDEHPDSSFSERYPEILDLLFFGVAARRPEDIPEDFWDPSVLREQASSLLSRKRRGTKHRRGA